MSTPSYPGARKPVRLNAPAVSDTSAEGVNKPVKLRDKIFCIMMSALLALQMVPAMALATVMGPVNEDHGLNAQASVVIVDAATVAEDLATKFGETATYTTVSGTAVTPAEMAHDTVYVVTTSEGTGSFVLFMYTTTETDTAEAPVVSNAVVALAGSEKDLLGVPLCGNIVEHTHGDSCYTLSCDHADGQHQPNCYSSSTAYALCEHSDDSQHTGTATLTDVVTINGTNVSWKTDHAAYPAVYAVYKAAYDSAYKTAYDAAPIFKDTAGKAAGVVAGAAALVGKTLCYTVSTSAVADQCQHGPEHSESCYTTSLLSGCPGYEHTHVDSCYSWTYTWNCYPDANGNGKADCNEQYTVTWLNDGEVFATEQVAYGAVPTAPAGTPTKDADAQYTYAFEGWDAAATLVTTKGATINAVYNTTTNEYTVTWVGDAGKVLETDTVAYGTVPTYDGVEPTKAADENHTYKFNGWTPEVEAVKGDATYTAVFAEDKEVYTVTYVTGFDGVNVRSDYLLEGNSGVEQPAVDVKDYDLVGWYTDAACTQAYTFGTPVTSDITLYAKWQSIYATVAVEGKVASSVSGQVEAPSTQTVTLTAAAGYCIDRVVVDGAPAATVVIADKGESATVTFDVAREAVYTIKAETTFIKTAVINVTDENPVAYYTGIDAADLEANIFNAVYVADGSNPVLTADQVTVEVYGSITRTWYDVTSTMGQTTVATAFISKSLTVRLTYAGDNHFYGNTSDEVTVALADSRTDWTSDIETEVTLSYESTDMYTDMVAAIGAPEGSTYSYVSLSNLGGTDLSLDHAGLQKAAAANPEGIEINVTHVGNDTLQAGTVKVKVNFTGVYYTVPVTGGTVNDKATTVKAFYGQPTTFTPDAVTDHAIHVVATDATLVANADGSYTLTDVNANTSIAITAVELFDVTYLVNTDAETVVEFWATEVEAGAAVPEPADDPSRGDWYSFDGWTLTEGTVTDGTVTGDLVFTALWTINIDNNQNGQPDQAELYTVVYMDEDGETVLATFEDLAWGSKTPVFTPEKANFKFSAWTPSWAQEIAAPADGNTITYVASWIENDKATVTFWSEGSATASVVYIGSIVDELIMGARDGFRFGGWYTDEACTEFYKFNTPVTGDLNLYALWVEQVTVTFEAGGVIEPQTFDKGGKATAPTAPELPNYTFLGWFAPEATEAFDFDTTVEANLTLTAKWLSHNSTVKVNGEDVEFTVNGGAETTVAKNTEVTVVVTPAEGFYLDEILFGAVDADGKNVDVDVDVEFDETSWTAAFTSGTSLTYVVDAKAVAMAETEIVVVEGLELEYYGAEITTDEIIAAAVEGVFAGEEQVGLSADVEAVVTSYELGDYKLFSYSLERQVKIADVETWVPYGTVVGNFSLDQVLNDLGTLGSIIPGVSDLLSQFDGFEIAYGTYRLGVTYAGSTTLLPATATIVFDVVEPGNQSNLTITLNEGAEFTYSPELTEEQILEAVFGSIVDEEGNAVEVTSEDLDIVVNIAAGTQKATVRYLGSELYAPATASVEITINKGETSLTVNSQILTYTAGGYNTNSFITTAPEADKITFVVGMGLGDNASADLGFNAWVNIPNLVNLDSLPEVVRPYLEKALGLLEDGSTMTVSELRSALELLINGFDEANGAIDGLNGILPEDWQIDFSFDPVVASTLISILEQIEQLEGVGDLTVYVTTQQQGVTVADAGVYLAGAVTADSNYNTDWGLGYIVVKPVTTQVDLAWNVVDENGLVTYHAIQDGIYDLGAHVLEAGLTAEQVAAANAQVQSIYLGIDINGEPVIVDSQYELNIGAYTQIAYMADLGNVMYYAVPLVRAFAVVTDTCTIEFDGGAEQFFTFTGEPQGVTASVYNRAGELLDPAYLTFTYLGIEGDGEGYYSTEAPVHAGAYSVIATYLDPSVTYAGINAAVMVITPAEATVAVSNLYHTYDGTAADVASMVSTTPADAKTAIVMAGLDVSGDFSENGLSAVYGVVNIDFPARVDALLQGYVPSAYGEGVTVTNVINKLVELEAQLAELGFGSEYVAQVVSVLQEMPATTTLTFKDQAEVNPSAPGAYLVYAFTMDPDYLFEHGLGVLVIAPEVSEVTLEWDYVDSNGIVTTVALEENPGLLNASAFDADGNETDDVVSYLFIGANTEGAYLGTADPTELAPGVYTQIAYVAAEISVDIHVAKPIMRTILVTPMVADVDFVDAQGENNERVFVYDGTAKAMDAKAYDVNGNELTAGTMTYLYTGIEADAQGYLSSEAPAVAGTYTVVATYLEYDANGNLLYAGISTGLMVILPAPATVDVADALHTYDGTPVDVEALVSVNPAEAQVAIVTAALNVSGDFSEAGLAAVASTVNIDFPARVDAVLELVVPTAYGEGISKTTMLTEKLVAVADALAQVGYEDENLAEFIGILEELPEGTVLTFHDQAEANPVTVGAYLVTAFVMDCDYIGAAPGMGVVIVAPAVALAELAWNYDDANGIVTTPAMVGGLDLGASAYVDGVLQGDVVVEYLFVGVNAEGLYVNTDEASSLTNGVYTQIAYIYDEVSASMVAALPIVRTIVVTPQTVDVDFTSAIGDNHLRLFTYDGTAKSMPVEVTTLDGTAIEGERLAANLTVTYVGVDAELNGYSSTEAPSMVGTYAVYASYVEYDANGELLYVGAAAGMMVIERAEGVFEVLDTEVCPTDENLWVEVEGDETYAAQLYVVTDTNGNANLVLPEGIEWTGAESYFVGDNVDQLIADLAAIELPEFMGGVQEMLDEVIGLIENVETQVLYVNAPLPTDEGTYTVRAVAFGSKLYEPARSIATLTIGHEMGEWTVYAKPACELPGLEVRECLNGCGHGESRDMGAPLGHEFGEWCVVDEATCTTDGLEQRDCVRNCGEFETNVIPATGHDMCDWYVVTKPGCTTEGLEERCCNNACGTFEHNVIPATGHTWGEWETVVEPTCKDGLEQRVCANDAEHVDENVLPATGHAMCDWYVVTKPGCETEGLEERCCDYACGTFEHNVIPATGHAWGEYQVIAQATCEGEGLERAFCANNPEHFDDRAIAPAGHVVAEAWTSDESGHWHECTIEGCGYATEVEEHEQHLVLKVEATLTEPGYTGDLVCVTCQYLIKQGEIIPATGLVSSLVEVDNMFYCNAPVEPAVTVVIEGVELVEGTDFTVEYANNVEVGTATATIIGIGSYEGTSTEATFEVLHVATPESFADFQAGQWYLTEGDGSFAGLKTLYMDYALATGLMSGYAGSGTGNFGPHDGLTRAQAAIVLFRIANPGVEAGGGADTTGLSDLVDGMYYTAAINWAYENGIITGHLGGQYAGQFRPDDTVTREQLAIMIYRFCVNVYGVADNGTSIAAAPDAAVVSEWALDGVEFCYANGIMTGSANSGKLNPENQVERCQAAKMFSVTDRNVIPQVL